MPTNPGLRIAPELTKEAHSECSVCRTSSHPEPHTAASTVTGLPLAAALSPRSCPHQLHTHPQRQGLLLAPFYRGHLKLREAESLADGEHRLSSDRSDAQSPCSKPPRHLASPDPWPSFRVTAPSLCVSRLAGQQQSHSSADN